METCEQREKAGSKGTGQSETIVHTWDFSAQTQSLKKWDAAMFGAVEDRRNWKMVRYTNLAFPNCMRDITQATPIFHNNSYSIIFLDSPLKNIHFGKTLWFVVLLFFPSTWTVSVTKWSNCNPYAYLKVLPHFTVLSLFRLQEHYLLYPLLQYN